MSQPLTQQKCLPCEVGGLALTPEQLPRFIEQLKKPWEIIDGTKIKHQFKFKTFKEAINFVNKVAELAENEGHHPDITINYNKVIIKLTTHALHGLSANDFIMASKIEML